MIELPIKSEQQGIAIRYSITDSSLPITYYQLPIPQF